MRNFWIYTVIVIACIGLMSCGAAKKPLTYEFKNYSTSPELFADPPRSVAILPFSNTIEESKLTIENWKKAAEKRFDIDEEQKRTEEYLKRMFVRRAFYKHFSVKPFRDMEIIAVDQTLKKHGIEWAEDLEKYTPQELAEMLGVDGLIYGEITHLNRVYLGLYSEVSVGCKLRFLDIHTGEDRIIWQLKDVEKNRAGGASLSLTGLATSILNATMNMRKIWIFRVSDELFRRVVDYLPDLDAAVEPVLIVTSDKAPLLHEPGLMGMGIGKKVKNLTASTTLTLLEEADGWYRVATEDGTEGWIDPDLTILSGKELGRPFDISAGPEDLGQPSDSELGGLFDLQGVEHFKQKKFSEAIESLEKATRYDPTNAASRFHLAWAYLMGPTGDQDKLALIITQLNKAVQISPDNINYRYNLGLAYNENDQVEKAISQWQKCLELDPNIENVKELLAIAQESLAPPASETEPAGEKPVEQEASESEPCDLELRE